MPANLFSLYKSLKPHFTPNNIRREIVWTLCVYVFFHAMRFCCVYLVI